MVKRKEKREKRKEKREKRKEKRRRKEKGEWVKGRRKGREGENGEGEGSGIITLRGNEKCEEKNSKYQWWGIGRYKGEKGKKKRKGKGRRKWRGRGKWDYYFER